MPSHLATLLLVDDNAMNRDALSRRLERTGYHVLVAESGEEALALAATHHIDLVLLDVMMPGMSGTETLTRLRQNRVLSDLPVIMVTAKDASGDMVEALDLGANDYVTKPVDYAVALARIRTQLTARRSDPLTGLPNRVLFMDRLTAVLQRPATTPDSGFAVFFIDVDRFKVVNDSLGHLAGDQLLVELSHRFQRSLRATDTVARISDCTLARMGGDEFTVLIDGVTAVDHACLVAERLLAVAGEPIALAGRDVTVTLSIGIVMSDPRYARADDMLRDADTAMYCAKASGKARVEVFDLSMLEAARARLQIETDLRNAVVNGELALHYQPIVAMRERRLSGFEALLRWHHPERGMVSPDQFIGIAEETGLIVEIGGWALAEACRQMRAWDAEFPEHRDLVMNVNLSARQCLEPQLLGDVTRVLSETGLPAHRLKLEITESVMLAESDLVEKTLHALHGMGVQLGLDDFGMGYSALSYLRRFPFRTIKIDRSFVSDIDNAEKVEIVRAIAALAAGLSMNVTAEGIETEEQVARLRQLDCELGQGFLFHRPLTSDKAREVLRADSIDAAAARSVA